MRSFAKHVALLVTTYPVITKAGLFPASAGRIECMKSLRSPRWFVDAAVMIIGPLLVVVLIVYWLLAPLWFPGIRD